MPGDDREQLALLLAENTRLKALLRQHGIAWAQEQPGPASESSARLSTDEKVKLFASLFRGREDVYPVRWESKAGKSGYSPACANEWRAGICEKPRIKCGDCAHRALIPVTGQTVFDHLAGRHTVGVAATPNTPQRPSPVRACTPSIPAATCSSPSGRRRCAMRCSASSSTTHTISMDRPRRLSPRPPRPACP